MVVLPIGAMANVLSVINACFGMSKVHVPHPNLGVNLMPKVKAKVDLNPLVLLRHPKILVRKRGHHNLVKLIAHLATLGAKRANAVILTVISGIPRFAIFGNVENANWEANALLFMLKFLEASKGHLLRIRSRVHLHRALRLCGIILRLLEILTLMVYRVQLEDAKSHAKRKLLRWPEKQKVVMLEQNIFCRDLWLRL